MDLALSQVEWSQRIGSEELVLTLYDCSSSALPGEEVVEKGPFVFVGIAVHQEHLSDYALVYTERQAPLSLAPLQLREQSEYQLEVAWRSRRGTSPSQRVVGHVSQQKGALVKGSLPTQRQEKDLLRAEETAGKGPSPSRRNLLQPKETAGKGPSPSRPKIPLEVTVEMSPSVLRPIPANRQTRGFRARLNFHDYVGSTTLSLQQGNETLLELPLEVRSRKVGYLEEYAALLDDLAQHASSLLLRMSSPVTAPFASTEEGEALGYEEFLLLRQLLQPEQLEAALQQIAQSPGCEVEAQLQEVQTGRHGLKSDELLSGYQRPRGFFRPSRPLPLPPGTHGLLPSHYQHRGRQMGWDVPENRFVRHLLDRLQQRLQHLHQLFTKTGQHNLAREVARLQSQLHQARHPVSFLDGLPSSLHHPLPRRRLTRRQGYRELLQIYDRLDRALLLRWDGLAEALAGPIRNMAQLYEYWCFFELLAVMEQLGDPLGDQVPLLHSTPRGLHLQLQRGHSSQVAFRYQQLPLTLYYQKRFSPGLEQQQSYSVGLTPDYALALHPPHEEPLWLCFDAKYRPEGSLEKMHAYRDALRPALGAYLFYPGQKEEPTLFSLQPGDPLPSVGAFPLRPNSPYRPALAHFLRSALDWLVIKCGFSPTNSVKSTCELEAKEKNGEQKTVGQVV